MNTLPKLLLMALLPTIASAEVITDGSMTGGAVTTLSGSDMQITADLGQQQGTNLFHSFSQFNIANNESATFSGPAEIANIISRITGGHASTIDGLLRSDIAGANLFLLNPAGVMFGANASLDISGSLHVGSADYLVLDDLTQFLATPLVGEILSTAAPAAFGFLGGSAGAIQLQGANLTLTRGKTVTLAANGVELDNANVEIDQGQVSLVSIGGAGEVNIETGEADNVSVFADINIVEQSYISANSVTLRGNDINLHNDSAIDISTDSANDAGNLVIEATNEVTISDSKLYATSEGEGNAGSIDIKAHHLQLSNATIDGGAFGQGAGANLTIQATKLEISDNTTIFTDALNKGNGGSINIQATDELTISDSELYANSSDQGNAGSIDIETDGLYIDSAGIYASTSGKGDGGFIEINAQSIELLNGGKIESNTRGSGDGGFIEIEADQVLINRNGSSSSTGIFGNAETGSSGDGGFIEINAQSIELLNGGEIESNTRGSGDAGLIEIEADQVLINRNGSSSSTGIFGNAATGSSGDGGFIEINARSIELLNGGKIESNTRGSGDGGLIEIEADQVLINRNGSSSSTGNFGRARSGSSGAAGDISINARSIELLDGGRISGSISGVGDGGTIAVVADQLLIDRMDGDDATGIFSQAGSDSSGNAGGISVSARSIELLDGGRISGSISGVGDGGTIAVVADQLLIDRMDGDDATGIFSQAGSDSSGNAGGISVSARSIELLDGGRISGSISGVGDGGTIAVVADQLLIDRMDGDDATGIFSSAGSSSTGGKGGQISVDAQALELRNGGIIQAATFSTGDGGLIEIEADQVLIDGNGSSSSTGIVGSAATSSSGAAGVLLINAQSIELLNGGEIESNTRGSGDAGSITVKADRLLIDSMNGNDKTGIFSSSENASTGNAGSIAVEARELQVQGSDSLIDTSTEASGNAGNIEVDSGTLVLADGGSIFSESTGTGRAGSISINAAGDVTINNGSSINTETIDGFDPDNPASIELIAGDLLLDGGSTITTNANGTANAGNIDLNVDKAIRLLANSSLSTESTRGGGGQINVIVNDLLYLKDSAMTTKVEQGGNQGDGGDIFVDPIFIVLDNSVITANAIDGNGGNITLIADYINQSTDSQITASSELGVDGEITIDALDAQVDAGEDSLSADLLDASQWQRQACAQRSGSDVSSFIISQRPLRPSPHDDWSVSREL